MSCTARATLRMPLRPHGVRGSGAVALGGVTPQHPGAWCRTGHRAPPGIPQRGYHCRVSGGTVEECGSPGRRPPNGARVSCGRWRAGVSKADRRRRRGDPRSLAVVNSTYLVVHRLHRTGSMWVTSSLPARADGASSETPTNASREAHRAIVRCSSAPHESSALRGTPRCRIQGACHDGHPTGVRVRSRMLGERAMASRN